MSEATPRGDPNGFESVVPNGPPLRVHHESTTNSIRFNVMPGRSVEETLYLSEYRVWSRYAEATFDRRYESQMRSSPNHLVFLTLLAHTQKLIYVCLCEELGIDYSPNAPEEFKIWPTAVQVKMPVMVRQAKGVLQRLWLTDVTTPESRRAMIRGHSSIEEAIDIEFESHLFLLRGE